MLMNGMAESRLPQIPMREISSPVLLSVFEFLYTGSLSKHNPLSWRMACEVIVASRFFLEPTLEKITRKVMHTLTLGVAQDLPKIASLLTEAVEFKPLRDEMDVNLMELVTILSSNWSDSVFVRSLSEQAFQYLLEKSKENFDEDEKFTVTEYLRFRQVIRWCISKSEEDTLYYRFRQVIRWCVCKSETVEELVNFIAPDEYQAWCLFIPDNPQKHGSLPRYASLLNGASFFPKNEKIRDLAIKLSSNIDCRKIHPILLATVVEPLNIISATEILDSFRFHSLRRTISFKGSECGWNLGKSYSTLEQGFVIKKHDMGIGLAVCKAAIWRSPGIYQWRFTVEEYPEPFCEFGFVYYGSDVGIDQPKLQGKRLSQCYRARVLNIQRMEDGIRVFINQKGSYYGPNSWHILSASNTFKKAVIFTFNAWDGTCSVGFDNRGGGVVWKNLPKAVYCPAMSLGNSSVGRVRIEFLSGFDIL